MVMMKKMKKSRLKGVLTSNLEYKQSKSAETDFKRADLIFNEVQHRNDSYEVWAYLNNTKASDRTPRDIEKGYAGRFIVFGHGGCWGDPGHCNDKARKPSPFDLRAEHHLVPQEKIITITDALNHVLDQDGGLKTVTLIPIVRKAKQSGCGRDSSIMNFENMELRLYA